jgi:hypothetical protein
VGVPGAPAKPPFDINARRLVHGARFRSLPLNVRCPGGCAFCYESRVSELIPQVATELIPRYDEERFDAFRQMHERALAWEAATGRWPLFSTLPAFERTPAGEIVHFPMCDVFSAGLTHAQIEELIAMRAGGDVCYLYAVGLDLDPDFVGHLTRRFPETFRLHLSIVTFDPGLRGRLMNPRIDLDALRRACAQTQGATFFLMLFDQAQLVADVEELLALTGEANGGFFFHRLYHDRLSPAGVVELAEAARGHREGAVRQIARLATGRRPLMCSLGGDLQAFTRRHEIHACLQVSTGEPDEVIFCSPAAFRVIDRYCGRSANLVRPLRSAFGGNIDFAQACTARDAISQLEALLAEGRQLRRVLLPSAMFWIDGAYDVEGVGVEAIARRFPELSVELLQIPPEVVGSVVSLGDCLAFFDDPNRLAFDADAG